MIDFTKDNFIQDVKDELRMFNNFASILEKAENDGYLKKLSYTMKDILINETEYAAKGDLTRVKEITREKAKSRYA